MLFTSTISKKFEILNHKMKLNFQSYISKFCIIFAILYFLNIKIINIDNFTNYISSIQIKGKIKQNLLIPLGTLLIYLAAFSMLSRIFMIYYFKYTKHEYRLLNFISLFIFLKIIAYLVYRFSFTDNKNISILPQKISDYLILPIDIISIFLIINAFYNQKNRKIIYFEPNEIFFVQTTDDNTKIKIKKRSKIIDESQQIITI